MSLPIEKTPESATEIRIGWDRIARGYAEFVSPTHFGLAGEALDRAGLRPGMRFLDVACGSGALSIPAARRGAKVLSVDLSPAMLDQLRSRATREGVDLETRAMDGHALELEDESVDLSGSQFGVMLFPDMPRGIREMARVTRPGGRVLMVVYGDPRKVEFFRFFVEALQTAVPGFTGPPMDQPPLPFQLRDPERLRGELAAAGLRDIRVETTSETLQFDSGRALWNWLIHSNPVVGSVLAEIDPTEEQQARIQQALEDRVRERAGGDGSAALTNPVHIGVGTK